MRASNAGRLILYTSYLREGPRLPFTARIERPPLHRGGSASKKDGLAALFSSFQACSFTSPEGGLIGLQLRASNEGLPRPRVARAKETNSLPVVFSFARCYNIL